MRKRSPAPQLCLCVCVCVSARVSLSRRLAGPEPGRWWPILILWILLTRDSGRMTVDPSAEMTDVCVPPPPDVIVTCVPAVFCLTPPG